MAKQRYINTHFWDDGYIRGLTATEKLLFLYLLTNPLTNIAGAYEIGLDRMEFDTQIGRETLEQILKKFQLDKKVAYREGWVFIANFIKNQSMSDKVLIGIVDAAKRCPDWIKDSIYTRYHTLSIRFDILNLKSNIKPKRATKKMGSSDPRVETIFEEMKTVLNHPSWILDAERHKTLAAWLDFYTVDQLKLVPHGALRTPWYMGENPRKKKYHEPSTLFKNAKTIDSLIEAANEPTVQVSVTNGKGLTQREQIAIEQERIRLENAQTIH
jgi:hypothetical protein